MPSNFEKLTVDGNELAFTCLIEASPAAAYRCWLEPELMTQWFTPAPWTTPHAETDPRVGGGNTITMRGPEGEEHVSHGIYLELVQDRKIIATDAYKAGWVPTEKPFMTMILTFEPEGSGSRYTARVRHWNAEDKETHEKMGFFEGWQAATAQMEDLVRKLGL